MIKTMAPPPSSAYAPAPSHRHHHHRHHHHHLPSAPTISISTLTSPNNQSSSSSSSATSQSNSKLTTVDFSPPLIAMVVVVAAAFLVITYSRLISRHLLRVLRRYRMWRRRRRFLRRYLPSSNGDIDSPPAALFDSPDGGGFHVYSPYGLDESVIKTIPLSRYYFDFDSQSNGRNSFHKPTVTVTAFANKDCAVCLLEFEDNDYVRTLPVCSHAFHVDCIDIWLRSHANCPLCRAGIFRPESSPFIPVMAARIRPSFDDSLILHRMSSAALDTILQSPPRAAADSTAEHTAATEITPCDDEPSPRRSSDDQFFRFNGGGRENFLLKRSYSFGFERSSASERMMVMEAATASPYRFRRGGSFWSKRPSPFGSLSKSRVFSFRHYRGMKSPAFFRRRTSSGLFPLSERFSSAGGSGWGSSSRRSKSVASPMFMRSSVGSGLAVFSSSRLRCGDPEALLSPERFNRR